MSLQYIELVHHKTANLHPAVGGLSHLATIHVTQARIVDYKVKHIGSEDFLTSGIPWTNVWRVRWPGPGKRESNDEYFQLSYCIKDTLSLIKLYLRL